MAAMMDTQNTDQCSVNLITKDNLVMHVIPTFQTALPCGTNALEFVSVKI